MSEKYNILYIAEGIIIGTATLKNNLAVSGKEENIHYYVT